MIAQRARSRASAKPRRVREGPREPAWVTLHVVRAVHGALIHEYGGKPGIRDEGLLEAAMNRPRNKHAYGETDIAVLAAAYAFGIARSHPFVDGNKRVAFVASVLFLRLHGRDLVAPEPEVVDVIVRLAAGRLTEAALAGWIRAHI
jgi:death-on-curing protein